MDYDLFDKRRRELALGVESAVFSERVHNTLPYSRTVMRPTYFRQYRHLLLDGDNILALLPSEEVCPPPDIHR